MNGREYLNNIKKIPKHDAKFGEILSDAAKRVDTTDKGLSVLQDDIAETKKIALQDMDKVERLDGVVKDIGEKVGDIKNAVEETNKKMEDRVASIDKKHTSATTAHEVRTDTAIEGLKSSKADKTQVQAEVSRLDGKIKATDVSIDALKSSIGKEILDIKEKPDREVINDELQSLETTYSSEKIESMVKRQVNTVSYGGGASKIDDTVTTDNRTWSSTKIQQEINDSAPSGTWGSIIGTLSNQTDLQTALDNKVTKNSNITGATKTKVTYDAKGLITAGTDATTADIADSTNKRYVTDANLVVIGNTSGTNTGDQTSIVGITGTKSQFDTAVTDGNFLYVGDVTQYTDELAQDAVGGMVDSTLTYVDGTPSLGINLSNANTWAADQSVPDEAYGVGRNGSMEVPTKNALYDKIETLGGGSGITRTIESKSSNFTAGSTASVDYVYFITGTTNCTLPTAVGNANRYTIKSISGTTTVAADGAETIDGSSTVGIANEDSVDLISNNTERKVV